jgi:flagellar basal-body rod modification protein FlgD
MATTSALDTLSQTSNPSKSQLAGNKLGSDYTFFLKMLTTQLQNQDPTAPMDVAQMTQQIAQYSSVEQQVQTNSNLEQLLASQKQSQLTTAVSYIGKEVETNGNSSSLYSVDSNGTKRATFSYTLPSAAASATVTISDSTGKVVFSGNGTLNKGRNVVVWDGKNSFDQSKMPDGTYTIAVKAKDANGANLAVTTHTVGIVTTVETAADGTIKMTVDNNVVNFSDITAVRNPT